MRNHGASSWDAPRHIGGIIPTKGASNASQLRPLEWAGQVAGAERLRDVAGTRLLKRQTPHPLALPHIKTET